MRVIGISLAFLLLEAAAVAQQPAAPPSAEAMKIFSSAADVQAMIAKAKKERKADQANYSQRILQLAPYNVSLEYRALVGPAAVHETEAEIFYVIDGGATLVTGGTLLNQTRTNPQNLSGTGIQGGASRSIAKGDFIMVPENTPHWFSPINGTLVVMSLHLPHPVPTTR
jgi:mannose-6-phosphate isomerase-like protein (cupin superfamily)